MRPIFRLPLAALLIPCLSIFALPRQASAHPMGNFTITRYSAITVGADSVERLYADDMVAIPAFQELGTIQCARSRVRPATRLGKADPRFPPPPPKPPPRCLQLRAGMTRRKYSERQADLRAGRQRLLALLGTGAGRRADRPD